MPATVPIGATRLWIAQKDWRVFFACELVHEMTSNGPLVRGRGAIAFLEDGIPDVERGVTFLPRDAYEQVVSFAGEIDDVMLWCDVLHDQLRAQGFEDIGDLIPPWSYDVAQEARRV